MIRITKNTQFKTLVNYWLKAKTYCDNLDDQNNSGEIRDFQKANLVQWNSNWGCCLRGPHPFRISKTIERTLL